MIFADLILAGFLIFLAWWLTGGFRRDVAVIVPLLLIAALIRFVVLPYVIRHIMTF